jgi:hypothetical protein
MRHVMQRASSVIAARLLIGALLSIILVAASAGTSRAMQLIPSLGFTKPTDATAGNGQLSGGLALRTSLIADVTTSRAGVHAGGGLAIPLSPSVGLDLNARYIFMQTDNSVQLPTQFNPDFWSTSLGLAIKF